MFHLLLGWKDRCIAGKLWRDKGQRRLVCCGKDFFIDDSGADFGTQRKSRSTAVLRQSVRWPPARRNCRPRADRLLGQHIIQLNVKCSPFGYIERIPHCRDANAIGPARATVTGS